jgi:hypothetical protein
MAKYDVPWQDIVWSQKDDADWYGHMSGRGSIRPDHGEWEGRRKGRPHYKTGKWIDDLNNEDVVLESSDMSEFLCGERDRDEGPIEQVTMLGADE